MFPELPAPELRGCFLYDQVLDWLRSHKTRVLRRSPELMPRRDVERELRGIAIRVIRTAVMATLYGSAMASVSASS